MSQFNIDFDHQPACNVLMVRDARGHYRAATSEEVVGHAKRWLAKRVRRGSVMSSPETVKDYLRVKLSGLEHEVFAVVFLDAQQHVIAFEELFRGTVTQTAVYPREVVKEALKVNAAGVIVAHNHPSGSAEPSNADTYLTQTLKAALALVDVKVLDHIVVGSDHVVSMAERGLV